MSSPPNAPRTANHERRASTLSDYFTANRVPQSYPGPIATAAAQASNRRQSFSGGSPPQFSSTFGMRRSSVSSVSSSSSAIDDSAVDDNEPASGSPTSPLARRMSWGARAFRDVRLPSVTPLNTSGGPKAAGVGPGSPTITKGFWMDNNRGPSDPAVQRRRMSTSSMPTPATSMPAPKEAAAPKTDYFQERILKGELYMD